MKSKSNELAKIEKQDFYIALIEEIKAILTEGVFDARQRVIEMHWQIGKRLLEDYENFGRARIYGEDIATRVAKSLFCSPRTINRAIQFVKKFPDLKDIEKLPDGKNLSWTKIVKQYLPEKSGKAHEHLWEKGQRCRNCGKFIKENKIN